MGFVWERKATAGPSTTVGMTLLFEGRGLDGNIWEALRAHCRSLHYATPDFLLTLVALVHFMRPSLRKGAHAALSNAAWQEIRVRSSRDDKGQSGASIRHRLLGSREQQVPPTALWSDRGTLVVDCDGGPESWMTRFEF